MKSDLERLAAATVMNSCASLLREVGADPRLEAMGQEIHDAVIRMVESVNSSSVDVHDLCNHWDIVKITIERCYLERDMPVLLEMSVGGVDESVHSMLLISAST